MFNQAELRAYLNATAIAPSPVPKIFRFGQFDFAHPASEEDIELHDFAVSAEVPWPAYWSASVSICRLVADGYKDRVIRDAHCRLIEVEDFRIIIEARTKSLKKPVDPIDEATFTKAFSMHDDWNFTSAIGVYPGRICVFYWQTTA